MDSDGTPNDDKPNYFNDLRMVIEFTNGKPKIVDCWEATTEPGYHYTYHPMNRKGAARIKFGQYRAWKVGYHGRADRHEALVQVRPITVYRDANKDMKRIGDKEDTGLFGIDQHWGYDLSRNNIKNASAGCLVGRTRAGHREFMSIIEQDRRYQKNRGYIFWTTVISGEDLAKVCPQ